MLLEKNDQFPVLRFRIIALKIRLKVQSSIYISRKERIASSLYTDINNRPEDKQKEDKNWKSISIGLSLRGIGIESNISASNHFLHFIINPEIFSIVSPCINIYVLHLKRPIPSGRFTILAREI